MGRIKKTAKLAAHKLDAAGLALKFVHEQGIEMKVAPSAENIVEGDVKLILGLVWGLMRKFIRFSDDDSGTRIIVTRSSYERFYGVWPLSEAARVVCRVLISVSAISYRHSQPLSC